MEKNWKQNTALFVGGQALTLFGSMVVQYAILWHITLKTQSGTMMTVFTIAGFIPMFFISPFGGVWADRFNKKNIINIADGAIAFVSLIVAVFLFFGFDHVGLLLACAVVRSLGQGVQMPAVGAFVPQIVPQEHLTRVNGIQGSIQSVSMLAAPMASGALMSFAPLETLFLVDVVTAAIGISILYFFVKVPQAPQEVPAAEGAVPEGNLGHMGIDYFRDLKEGLRYIRQHRFILRLILLSVGFFIAVSPTAFLTTLQVTRDFGADVWRLTAIEVAFLAGMIAGGILIGTWGGFKNRIYTMALSCALCGIESIGLGLAPVFWIYLVIMGTMGLTMPLYNTPSTVLLQTKVEQAYMGRVFAVFSMVSSIMMPAGMLLFGPLADIVTIDSLLIISGGVIVLLSIPFVASKTLREAGKTAITAGQLNSAPSVPCAENGGR
jgi:DHA3 family macrolide efflux protein-like MFS transporter